MGTPKGGATTSNYLMESPSILPEITDFTISSGRVSLAMNNGHAKNGMEMLSTRTSAREEKERCQILLALVQVGFNQVRRRSLQNRASSTTRFYYVTSNTSQ